MSAFLPLLTNSSCTCFRRCPREYYFKYVLLRRPRRKTDALRFGSFFHLGLNAWWSVGDVSQSTKLDAAVHAMDPTTGDVDLFDHAKAVALMIGYTAMWGDVRYETLAVERQFRLPLNVGRLIGPASKFDLGGAIDAIVRDAKGNVALLEHKTTSEDISPTSDYWRHVVALDPQVSTYMSAAKALGYDPRSCIYDVIRKPTLTPARATPEDKKKYTKPTKADPLPRLYAGQRETDETPEEYSARLLEDIQSQPDRYFARQVIVRLEHDNDAHAEDVRMTAEAIEFATERSAFPRTPSACERYHRLCEYHDVCSGNASIDDAQFESKARAHEELAP